MGPAEPFTKLPTASHPADRAHHAPLGEEMAGCLLRLAPAETGGGDEASKTWVMPLHDHRT